ncbi:CGNR zinc finger domain-containing protein [Nonomuraea sp. bgisy101]|uniref:CGNR zinc finger domain-containing protein n=1 Tax=Nonomuraea sp. bgisy101 TaxID=3413784 RepID=UPI003D74CB3F
MRTRDWVWDGGRPALDFVNTYRDRKTGGRELLREPEDLLAWLGLPEDLPFAPSPQESSVAGTTLLMAARELREAICRCVDAAAAGESGFPEPINRWASRRQPALVELGSDLSVVRLPPADPVVAGLAEIASDAVELIGGPDLHQVRVCASPTCGLRFADRSNAGTRQWCSMKRCGNREKVRLHRARRTDQ